MAFREKVPQFGVKYLFNCENNARKREWIMRLHGAPEGEIKADPTLVDQPCMFGCISKIGLRFAPCFTHGGECKVPSVDVFIACTSCKDFSKAKPGKRGPVFTEQATTGGSAQTLHGMLEYIEKHRPVIVLFENVDAIEDAPKDTEHSFSDMDLICAEWASRGFETQKAHVNSALFGVPTVRQRLVAASVLTVANPSVSFQDREPSAVFRTMRTLLGVCARSSVCAADYILPAADAAVNRELERRAKGGNKTVPYNVSLAMKSASSLGVPWGAFPPPPYLVGSPWFSTLTPEQRDSLCFSLRYLPKPLLLRDCGQSLARVRTSTIDETGFHLAPTMMPKQLCMVFDQVQPPRVLLGREALWMHGFPIGDEDIAPLLDKESEAFLADLAGNMVPLPVALALIMASIAALSWRSTDASATQLSATDTVECETALDSFALCAGTSQPASSASRRLGLLKRLRKV